MTWQPIETARDWLRGQGLPMLMEKGASICTWGPVLLLCPKDHSVSGAHVYVGKLIDWGANDKNTHWRTAESYDDDTLKPTHWMPLPEPPKP